MKSSTFILFMMVILAATLAPILARPHGHVEDTLGGIIRPGLTYYIVPAKPDTLGGLIPTSQTPNKVNEPETCSLDIIQSPKSLDLGLPIKFNTDLWFVKVFDNLTIEFESSNSICSKNWGIKHSEEFKKTLVSIGVDNSPLSGGFQIHEFGCGYKIVYCTVTSHVCANVGVFTDDLSGVRRLALTSDDNILEVKFIKTQEAAKSKADFKSDLGMFPLSY